MPRIRNTVDAWKQFDQHTEVKGTAGQPQVDHAASAVTNLSAVGKDALDMVDPTNHFRATWSQPGTDGAGLKVLLLPWDAAGEVMDVVLGPAKILKNGLDALVHGALAGVDKVRGR